ncbi:MAG: alpha/beta hydrolase [Acidimicrobiales bacterium]
MASETRTRARTGSYGRAVATYVRKHAFAPRYRPEQALSLVAADGVRLSGARLDGPPSAFASVVLVHGLMHSSRTPRIHAFAHWLARDVNVLVPELRGHGRSEGACSFCKDEPRDVEAAVQGASAAWPGVPVVTVGASLGGAAALLHAGMYGGVAGVVAVSAPAEWRPDEAAATRRVYRYATTRAGRTFVTYAFRTRLGDRCDGVPGSRHLVAAIAPAFTLVVHDPADHYFGRDHPEAVYEWAREPKGLWWEHGAGHGTDLLTADFAGRLLAELRRRLAATA